MSFEVKKISADGTEFAYMKFGSGKTPLVIIPGLSLQSVIPAAEAIEKHYQVFTEEFCVYLFDSPEAPGEGYNIDRYAADIYAAIKKLGLESICLFGVSQGGMVAQTVTVSHPELVAGLALGSTACRMDPDRHEVVDTWTALARQGKCEELYLAFGERVYPPETFESFKQAFSQAAKTVTEADLKRFVILGNGSAGFDVSDKLSRIGCPVLVIGDTDDRVLGAEASYEIKEKIKDARLYMYEGCGHAAYDTAPDYAERLYSFFKSINNTVR